MYYHLRFTPYELSNENLTTFCNKYDKFIIARERFKKDGITPTKEHFHIWIDSLISLDAIRVAFRKALCIPKGGRGTNNKYYVLKEWNDDVKYITKQGDIVASKGVDQDTLRVVPYKGEPEKEIQAKGGALPLPPPPKKEKESFWKQILEEAMFLQLKQKKTIDIEEAVKLISRVYIKKMMPLPHPGDRKRWAVSLVMYGKMNFDPNQDPTLTESIIQDESMTFIAEHLIFKQT